MQEEFIDDRMRNSVLFGHVVEEEEEEEEEMAESLPEIPGTMSVGCSEALIETIGADGERQMVNTASRYLDDMIRARKGYISPKQALAEARAMKQILLEKEGIPKYPDDPTSNEMRFINWNNDEEVKKLVEYKQVGVFTARDVDTDPAPTDETGSDTIGRYAPGDYILFDRTRDVHFPLSSDAPIPMDDTEVELTLRDQAHSIEQMLMNYPLINIPVYTPLIMPLLHEGIKWPVVIDSFTLFRYQMVMKRILSSLWKFDYQSDMSYLDSALEKTVRECVADREEWIPALPPPTVMETLVPPSGHRGPVVPPSGSEGSVVDAPEEEEERMVESDKTPKTGKLPTTLEQWWHCLPVWFRNATKTGIQVEEWATTLFKARLKGRGSKRRAVVPTDEQLEGIMAEWATLQHQIRMNHVTLTLSDGLDQRLDAHGFDPVFPERAVLHVPFLKDMLVIVQNATVQYLRANEALMLRMMARHVPVDQWEWFESDPVASPLFDGKGMITEEEAVKSRTYRSQVRKVRIKCLSLRDAPLDETAPIVHGAPTYADMSCLWTWYNFKIPSEEKFNRLQELIVEVIPTIERMKKRVEYVPDAETMAPLIARLDAQGIPNSMRDAYLRGDPAESGPDERSKRGGGEKISEKQKRAAREDGP